MSFLSKAWKGIKKVVKGAARRIKKVAKGIVTSTPLGQKLWKEGGRLGKKVLGAINKIGPIGMIAISVIAPYLAPLWSAFGAAAGAAAGAGSIWGSIGTAIYNGANWVGSTLSSLTSGISKGISTVVDGGFKGIAQGSLGEAGKQVVSGLTNAFSGQAGAQGVAQGIANSAAQQAAANAAGQSVWKQAGQEIFSDVLGSSAGNAATEEIASEAANKALEPGGFSPIEGPALDGNSIQGAMNPGQVQMSQAPNVIEQQIASGQTTASWDRTVQAASNVAKTPGMNTSTAGTGTSLLDKAMKVGKALTTGFDGQAQQQVYSPISAGGGNFFRGNAAGEGGVGSAGGDFLSQNMLQMMQQTQQRMARGFG